MQRWRAGASLWYAYYKPSINARRYHWWYRYARSVRGTEPQVSLVGEHVGRFLRHGCVASYALTVAREGFQSAEAVRVCITNPSAGKPLNAQIEDQVRRAISVFPSRPLIPETFDFALARAFAWAEWNARRVSAALQVAAMASGRRRNYSGSLAAIKLIGQLLEQFPDLSLCGRIDDRRARSGDCTYQRERGYRQRRYNPDR